MKKICSVLLTILLAATVLLACAPKAEGAAAEPIMPAAPEATDEAVGLVNPMTDYKSLEEMLAAAPGINMRQVPEGATDVTYSTITGGEVSPIAQIQFKYGGDDYCYRAAVCKAEADMQDIAGVYDELAKQKDIVTDPNATYGGVYSLQCNDGSTLGLATWFYAPTACQYSLFTKTGCGDDQKIEEVVDWLLPITLGVDGQPLELPQTTMAPDATKVTGTVEGVVVSLTENEIVINMDNGNTLTFLMSNIVSVDAARGDKVKIDYSGNIVEAPEAVTITVTEKTAALISGTVMQHDKESLFVQTATGNIYGFVINDKTVVSGADKVVTTDASVKVTYMGELVEKPIAVEIEIVKAGKDKPADDPLVNKTLDGNVTKLQSKWVYIHTNAGHNYKFQRTDVTKYTGSYALELGAKIKVTYDGYASNSPVAKVVKVLAPPDPTPPAPKTHKVTGVITARAGNMLAIETSSGADYSFLLGAPSISGDTSAGVGDNATVTFYYESDGTMCVTKIKYSLVVYTDDVMPYVVAPGPVIGE